MFTPEPRADAHTSLSFQSPPLWTVFLLLVYEPLGRHRVPALGVDLATEAAHKSVRTIVQEAGFSPEQYRTLRELLSQGNQTAA